MTITDWLEITITFNAKCNECGKDVLPGKALWSSSAKASRHLSCDKKISKDIRDVLKIAKLCNPADTEEDINRLITIHHKYRKTGNEYNS